MFDDLLSVDGKRNSNKFIEDKDGDKIEHYCGKLIMKIAFKLTSCCQGHKILVTAKQDSIDNFSPHTRIGFGTGPSLAKK